MNIMNYYYLKIRPVSCDPSKEFTSVLRDPIPQWRIFIHEAEKFRVIKNQLVSISLQSALYKETLYRNDRNCSFLNWACSLYIPKYCTSTKYLGSFLARDKDATSLLCPMTCLSSNTKS